MNFFKRLFGLGKESKPSEASIITPEIPVEEKQIRGECYYCKINNNPSNVYMDQHWSKQQGKLFHRDCYKQAKKQAKEGNILP